MAEITHTPSDLAGRVRFMPGYPVMLQMCGQLIHEATADEGSVLVVGAGGGLEIEALSQRAPAWRFCGVDPTPNMIADARARVRACGADARVTRVEGYVHDAPLTKHDAATCLLTLHFVPDDGQKLHTLRAIRERLKPGAPFVLVDCCLDKGASNFAERLERYCQFALDSGAPAEQLDVARDRMTNVGQTVSAAREAELLREAGFSGIELFYAGHSWRGWVSYA